MFTLCRDCFHLAEEDCDSCTQCGHHRVIRNRYITTLGIAHLDCDAFFAAVEKRDNPGLEDKPVIIGGRQRGVVSTCCYIARLYGVHSAMPMFKALQACPDAVVISNGDVTPIGDALESWAEGMKKAAADGSSARVSFRFASRQDNERSAFEIGIFKYTSVDSSGTETQMFMHFESVLVKKEGRWLFLLERQFDETNEAAWKALQN